MRSLIAVALGGLLLSGAFVAIAPRARAPEPKLAVSSSRAEVLPSRAPTCAYGAGETLALRLDSEVSTPDSPVADILAATLSLRVTDRSEGQATLRATLTDVVLRQQLSKPEDRVQHDLSAAFEMDVSEDCRVLAFRFPGEWSDAGRLLVASSLQFHEYVLRDRPSWELEQSDGVGRYRARYLRDGPRVERRKLFYALEGEEVFGLSVALPVSTAEARFDARGLLSSTVEERLRVSVRGELSADLEMRSTMLRIDGGFIEPPDVGLLVLFDPSAPSPLPEDSLPEAPSDEGTARAVFEKLADRLAGWTVRDARKMAGLLATYPHLADHLVLRLDDPSLSGGERASVFWALELASTPEAKRHLRTLAVAADLPHDRIRAAAALSAARQGSLEDGQLLASLHEQDQDRTVASAALLALGSLGQEAPSELSGFVRQTLRSELAQAQSTDDLRVTLRAVGNTGDAELLDVPLEYLQNEDPQLRALAASALRGMGSDGVSALRAALDSETSRDAATVMARTLVELGPPGPLDVAWAEARLGVTSAASVRAHLIEWLGGAESSEARAALARHFQAEPSSHLRQRIGRFVSLAELSP